MNEQQQPSLFDDKIEIEGVVEAIHNILRLRSQPSAWELLQYLDDKTGLKARWSLRDAIGQITEDTSLSSATRNYLHYLLNSEDLSDALYGKSKPGREIESSIDSLIQSSNAYRNSEAFQDMVSFMANFRDYAPFNNMLVKLQNPSCGYYATKADWKKRFKREIIEDAHPMLILAPMHPVMLVYDLDQTEGEPLPEELQNFATFEGQWEPQWLERTIMNAMERDCIRVDFKNLSSTNAGFATIAYGKGDAKMRIAIHNEMDEPSRYGVLCHELAHIYLGHLGGDSDGWWPSRGDLNRRAVEVEAEAVAYLVTCRMGLNGTSSQYVSRYLDDAAVLKTVSLDLIAKVAGRIEEMATKRLPKRHVRKKKETLL